MRINFIGAVLTAGLIGYANAGCQIYKSTFTADGTWCVDDNARALFAALNDFRVNGKTSTWYTNATYGL
jgi:hypothetical protein